MQTLWQDLRYGTRMLLKQPSFTLIAVVTLALGIGANTAIFSVVNALILQPPRLADAERVVALWRTPKDKRAEGYVSYLEWQDWRARSHSFATLAAYKLNGFTLLNEGQAERILGMRVSANFLTLLQVRPSRGRDFQEAEELRGAAPVVIVSHQFWQTRLGGNEAALGQPLTLNGRQFTVIGVLPPDFIFPLVSKDAGKDNLDLLTTIAGEGGNLEQRGAQVLKIVGRLQPDASFAQAQTEMTAIAAQLEQEHPQYSRDTTIYPVPVGEQLVGRDMRRALWLLLGTVGFVLLIACVNVANLLLSRAAVRQKELVLRVALGASRWRIARHLLTESLLLALVAGGAGLLLAAWSLSALRVYGAEQLPRLDEVQLDGRVLAFTLVVSLLAALLFSLLPIINSARPDLNEVLKAGAKSATGGRTVRWWRDALVVAEVALGLVLLVGAGLMLRSFLTLVNVAPGFDPTNVLTGAISLNRANYEKHEARVQYVEQTLERLRALPGVTSAAFVAPMPFSGGNVFSDFRIERRPAPEPGKEPEASNRSVTPEYFQALGIPLRQGRFFTAQDQRGNLGAAIINETLARTYFPDENPLGKYIKNIGANQNDGDPERWEIVGVVGDVHHSTLTNPARPEIYLPYQQNSWGWGNFFVRTTTDAASLTRSFSETVRAGDHTAPLTNVNLLTQAIANTVAEARFYTVLFALFGATGLLLTLTGIYGVISYAVAQQTREIGIRLALGAQNVDVLRLVLGYGAMLTVAGLTLGGAAAWLLTRLLQGLLFNISATDPLTFGLMAALLAMVAMLACWVPARRATKVDPMIALRYE
jgi:predicted permease